MTTSYVVVGIIVLVIIVIVAVYNNLVRLRNRVEEAWSDIDVQLKRRYDLIPNLINTVKGYAAHEQDTLNQVTQARTQAMNSQQSKGDAKTQAENENMLSSTLKSLFAVSENYPDLKANQNFLELQQELSDTENKIQAARRFYNGNVLSYNTKIQTVPANIIANILKFTEKDFFELTEEKAKEAPKVNF